MTTIISDESIQIDKLQLGPYGTNCYTVVCQRTRASLVIDAPAESDRIVAQLKNTNPRYILLTHDHMDHTGALADLRSTLGIPLAAHVLDSGSISPAPEMLLEDGATILLGNLEFRVLHTPGHTPGGLCFLCGRYLFSGDSLFPGGPGKTWSPSAFRQIVDSLNRKIFVLPDDTRVYPGHGDITVLKKEKEEYAVFNSRQHSPDLCGDVIWLTS
jgi:glyoxylase-like metal-dependent hydrolase (beta-lactamase superfamily II)